MSPTKNILTSEKIKLNLGCGKAHKKGYINIDIQEPCDLKHDLRTPLPFKDSSVDEVFSEGFIWLLSRQEWHRLKKEIARVLKSEGKLGVTFLDFEYILRAFLENKDGKRWGWWWQTIFSSQENEYDCSKNGFTYEKLVSDLEEEGMTDFSKIPLEKSEYLHMICHKGPRKQQKKQIMKVLIGTPIHEVKDYCMERWLENVSELQQQYPTDLFLVDNSPGLDYMEKVKAYCRKYGITNYIIKHIDVHQPNGADERIGRSRETIRQHILANQYDAWFSWECDQIIPPDALTKLVALMEKGDYTMVCHGSPAREVPNQAIAAFGVTLIGKSPLEKFGFLLEHPDMSDNWHAGEAWFKKQIRESGGNYIEVFGIISPIYHLDK